MCIKSHPESTIAITPTALNGSKNFAVAKDLGFEWRRRKFGEIVVIREGKTVAVLRGRTADRFLEAVERDDPQMVMAKVTGNYRRGNERL